MVHGGRGPHGLGLVNISASIQYCPGSGSNHVASTPSSLPTLLFRLPNPALSLRPSASIHPRWWLAPQVIERMSENVLALSWLGLR